MTPFDYRESTISFDYVDKTVEFYFTKQSDYTRCLKRNPNCVSHKDLDPGYIIVYPFEQCRTPDYLLRVSQ